MATFQAGAIPSPFGNVLFNPMAVDQAVQARQHNALLMDSERQQMDAQRQQMDAQRQQMGRQNEVDSREHVAQVAGYILSQPPETRPTAYKAALEWSRANGHPLPNAPAEYPGDQQLQMLQAMGIPAGQQYTMGMNRQANTAMLPPQGGAAAPSVSPYVPRNLPAGVTPDEDATVRTVIGEAGGESLDGRRAVAHVINNRATSSGMSPLDVTQAQGQFEPWGNPATRARLEGIDPNSAEYRQTLELVRNRGEDPTGGATHFFAPKLQASLGRDVPSWATGTPTVIGGHNFYKVGYGAPGGAQPGTTMVAGPGAPTGGAPAAQTTPGPGQYTPEQMRTLRAMQAADRPNTELRAEMDRYDAVNAHAAEQVYRRQRDAAADAQHAAKEARETAPFGGTGDAAEAKTQMRSLVSKIRDGSASQAERDDYALSAEHFLKPTMQWVEDGKGGQQLVAVPGKMPEGFPHPTFRPGTPDAETKPPPPTKRGQPLPQADRTLLIGNAGKLDGLSELINTFKPEYGGHLTSTYGDLRNTVERNTTGGPQSDWWQNYQRQKLAVRQGISGQSLTASELAEFDKADITTGMSPASIETNLKHQLKVLQTAQDRWIASLRAGGFNPEEIDASSKPAGQTPSVSRTTSVVKTADDYAKIPPGGDYTDPDGHIRRKPQ